MTISPDQKDIDPQSNAPNNRAWKYMKQKAERTERRNRQIHNDNFSFQHPSLNSWQNNVIQDIEYLNWWVYQLT